MWYILLETQKGVFLNTKKYEVGLWQRIKQLKIAKKAEEVKETKVEELEEVKDVKEEKKATKEDKKKTKEDKKKLKEEKKKEKESKKADKKDGYFKTVGKELKKVVWPDAGEISKYSLAVIILCILLILFFLGVDALASFIKGLF